MTTTPFGPVTAVRWEKRERLSDGEPFISLIVTQTVLGSTSSGGSAFSQPEQSVPMRMEMLPLAEQLCKADPKTGLKPPMPGGIVRVPKQAYTWEDRDGNERVLTVGWEYVADQQLAERYQRGDFSGLQIDFGNASVDVGTGEILAVEEDEDLVAE